MLAAGHEQLRDQPPVAAPPERLGAHEARGGLCERIPQRRLPPIRPHSRRVAAERTDPEAGESLLARLAGSPAAELDGMAIRDSRTFERRGQRLLVELRVATRARKATDVDECPHAAIVQRLE